MILDVPENSTCKNCKYSDGMDFVDDDCYVMLYCLHPEIHDYIHPLYCECSLKNN